MLEVQQYDRNPSLFRRQEEFTWRVTRGKLKLDHRYLPSKKDMRALWVTFHVNEPVPERQRLKVLYVCGCCFTSECFENEGVFNAGFASKLRLKKINNSNSLWSTHYFSNSKYILIYCFVVTVVNYDMDLIKMLLFNRQLPIGCVT